MSQKKYLYFKQSGKALKGTPKQPTGDEMVPRSTTSVIYSGPAPSAPVASPTEKIKVSNWMVYGRLRVTWGSVPSGWETIERCLGSIIDDYDGNPVFKTPIFCLYWLLGMHLRDSEGPVNKYTRLSEVSEPLNFAHNIALLDSQDFEYTYNTQGSCRMVAYSIQFFCKFRGTKRKTVRFENLVRDEGQSEPGRRVFSDIIIDSGITLGVHEDRVTFSAPL